MSSLNAYFQDFAISSLTSQAHYKLMIHGDLPTCTYIDRSVNIDKFGLDVTLDRHDMQNISCLSSLKSWSFLSVQGGGRGWQICCGVICLKFSDLQAFGSPSVGGAVIFQGCLSVYYRMYARTVYF